MPNEPGPISDNAPKANQSDTVTDTVKMPRIKFKRSVKIIIPFDENLQEFKLWDFLYNDHDRYNLEVEVDWTNKNQIYEIKGFLSDIKSLIKFLKENQILYYLT
tara:strand:+ start:722 stop:1033 length:312 start_codon:yes stop_codon:yes gene_type:complete